MGNNNYLFSRAYFLFEYNPTNIRGSNYAVYHSVLSFMAGLIVNLLQLKFQGYGTSSTASSPFCTHTATMLFAILSLLLYCLAALIAANTTSVSSLLTLILAKIDCSAEQLMVLFGSMASASLGYLLLPGSVQNYVLYIFYALVGFIVLLRCPSFLPNRARSSRGNLLPVLTRETYPSQF